VTLLEIDEVRGGYAEVDILNGISLSLQKGEILTVAGTNGAGKSTLAKAIVGLLPRVQGRIVFEGADLAPLPTTRHGMLFGTPAVNWHWVVIASLTVTPDEFKY